VAEDEGDVFPSAEIGQPVPGVDALDADDEAVPVGLDHFEEGAGVGRAVLVDEDFAVGVEDAEAHGSRVQVDPAPVAVLSVVESHGSSSCADARV
jgi:hypothetical protein